MLYQYMNEQWERALPIGVWNRTDVILFIPYVEEANIFGICYTSTITGTIEGTWTHLA
jgi:hypothetical protein